jgi:hypothetical protein
VKSRLPNRAQPVPPVFQPEVAADAIMSAADSGRREMYVGMPTIQAIVGNKLAAGLLDRFLARIGYAAQQTEEPENPDLTICGHRCRVTTARMGASTPSLTIRVPNSGSPNIEA